MTLGLLVNAATNLPVERSLAPRLAVLDELDEEILLTCARLGRITHLHALQIIPMPLQPSKRTIQRRMLRLYRLGYLNLARYSAERKQNAAKNQTRYLTRLTNLYILTAAGYTVVQYCYPAIEYTRDKWVIQGDGAVTHHAQHQIEYADMVMDALDAARSIPGIVGAYSATEMQLGPEQSPRADGVLIIRRWNTATEANALVDVRVPWLNHGRIRHHQTDTAFAIEIDRKTENPHVLEGKARSYYTVWQNTAWWQPRYPWPTPVFVVPNAYRLNVVLEEWQRGWPDGEIYVTERSALQQHGVAAPIWTHLRRTTVTRARSIFDPLLVPVLPDADPLDTLKKKQKRHD